jgi:lipopolysaccharide export system permease protein
MKKIDKLIINAFIGPFILTFLVVVFILLTVQMMNYVDEIFGKDLRWTDLGQLIFHFSVFQTPIAFPLSIMLASLMAFGNLGEHFELTAIKSAGISLVRALMPIYIMVSLITLLAFYSNNYFVPYSALKAYSLLYDIRQKKPALDIQPGQFYAGIENYMIKVDSKGGDGKSLKGLTIYDHTNHRGNTEVIMADSGMMYTILNDQYLKFELFNGVHYTEGDAPAKRGARGRRQIAIKPFTRTSFQRSEMIFDLSSFSMSRTDEGLFASNRLMRNFSQLHGDLDSLGNQINLSAGEIYTLPSRYFTYSMAKNSVEMPEEVEQALDRADSIRQMEVMKERLSQENRESYMQKATVAKAPVRNINLRKPTLSRPQKMADPIRQNKKLKFDKDGRVETEIAEIDSTFSNEEIIMLNGYYNRIARKNNISRQLKTAISTARQVKSKLVSQNNRRERLTKDYYVFDIQWHKMLATAFACISMFLIGAPLGAIIKRGGLGFPVIISVLFFIIYYVISIGGEKYAKTGTVDVWVGVWTANFILLPIGLVFLRQAKNDARLFEADFYKVMISRFQGWFIRQTRRKNGARKVENKNQ